MRRMFFFFALLFLMSTPSTLHAARRGHRHRPRHRIVSSSIFSHYPMLRGSNELIARENDVMDSARVPRLIDQGDVAKYARRGDLVMVPILGKGYALDGVEEDYLRPAALDYLDYIGRRFERVFGVLLKTTSILRTYVDQRRLTHFNPNAISHSLHLTGYAMDISAKEVFSRGEFIPMTESEKWWLAHALADDMKSGRIGATYECRAALDFHIVVFPQALR